MKKATKLAAALMVVAMAATQAFAVPSGKSVQWKTPMGTVTFKGADHAGKGIKCSACHPKIWKMKKGAAMKMADINAGKYCGSCHNGKRAFKPAGNCAKCHKK